MPIPIRKHTEINKIGFFIVLMIFILFISNIIVFGALDTSEISNSNINSTRNTEYILNSSIYDHSLQQLIVKSGAKFSTNWTDGEAMIHDLEKNKPEVVIVSSPISFSTSTKIPEHISLIVINGGKILVSKGSKLTINGPFNCGIFQVFEGNGKIRFGLGVSKQIFPEWWGVNGLDDTSAIQSAFNSTESGIIQFSSGKVYTYTSGIIVADKSNFIINGNSATLRARSDLNTIKNGNWGIKFQNCTDCIVNDLVIDGNRQRRTILNQSTNHNIEITTRNRNITFNNCSSINSVSDGWIINSSTPSIFASLPTDITLKNCLSNNSYRNGLSAIDSVRLKIIGGTYSNSNGYYESAVSRGLTPIGSGIDIEGDQGSIYSNSDTEITDVTIDGNSGVGLTHYGKNPSEGVTISNCHIDNNGEGAIEAANTGKLFIKNIYITSNKLNFKGVVRIGFTGGDVAIDGITFINVFSPRHDKGALLFIGRKSVVNNIYADGFNITGISVWGKSSTIKNVILKSCTGNRPISINETERIALINIVIEKSVYGIYHAGVDCDLLNLSISNCADTTAIIVFDTSFSGGTLNGLNVKQSTPIPNGQKILYFNSIKKPLKELSGVTATSNEYIYKNSDMVYAPKRLVFSATSISNVVPNFMKQSFEYNLPTLNPNKYHSITINHQWALIGDRFVVSSSKGNSPLLATAVLNDNNGNVKVTWFNPTSMPISTTNLSWNLEAIRFPSNP